MLALYSDTADQLCRQSVGQIQSLGLHLCRFVWIRSLQCGRALCRALCKTWMDHHCVRRSCAECPSHDECGYWWCHWPVCSFGGKYGVLIFLLAQRARCHILCVSVPYRTVGKCLFFRHRDQVRSNSLSSISFFSLSDWEWP